MTTPPSPRMPRADIMLAEERVEKPATRELRVRVDAAYVERLHALRFLRNKPMGEAIQEALDLYFERSDLR